VTVEGRFGVDVSVMSGWQIADIRLPLSGVRTP
jgi:hypothetical protein